jgi:hypothetical protein
MDLNIEQRNKGKKCVNSLKHNILRELNTFYINLFYANYFCFITYLYHIYIYIYIFNCNWVDTRWQQCSTHLHTNSTHNTENGTYITIKRKKIGKCGPCPVFASYTLAFALRLRNKHGITSVRVVEKCSDIPVAV